MADNFTFNKAVKDYDKFSERVTSMLAHGGEANREAAKAAAQAMTAAAILAQAAASRNS